MMAALSRSSKRFLLSAMLLVTVAVAGCALLPGMANPQATATPRMVSANLAVLGGTQEAFARKFGPPEHIPYFYKFKTTAGDSVLLSLGTLHNLVTGEVRVRMITLEPDDNVMWDAATAKALYESFFPPDSKFTHDGAGATGASGTYLFYTSTLLANTFPAQAFLDAAGKQLPLGTFEVVCNNRIAPSEGEANGCGLAIGEWPRF